MKKILLLPAIVMISVTLFSSQTVNAISPLDLTGLDNFAILAVTYTNADASTILHGDLGYTTGPLPANTPTLAPGVIIADPAPAYGIAEGHQATLLTDANAQGCTVFSALTVLDSLSPLGPGVYCFSGALSIVSAVLLTGSGPHIFKIAGALDAVAGSTVTLDVGVTSNDVFWVPVGATTLGADSHFAGNVLSSAASATTLFGHVTMDGRILSNGAVTTGLFDTITPLKVTTPPAIPEFPIPFSMIIIFVAVAAVYMGVRQKMIPGFKSF